MACCKAWWIPGSEAIKLSSDGAPAAQLQIRAQLFEMILWAVPESRSLNLKRAIVNKESIGHKLVLLNISLD